MSIIKKLWDGLDLLMNRKSRLYSVMREGEILHLQQTLEGSIFNIECLYTEQAREYALPFNFKQWRYVIEVRVIVNETTPVVMKPYLVRRKIHIVNSCRRLTNMQLRELAQESILMYFQAIFDHRQKHSWSKYLLPT